MAIAGAVSVLGSSPHVRGAPSTQTTLTTTNRDHPRMCGEHAEDSARIELQWGSSPHVRGALDLYTPDENDDGIIPACAGST